MTTLTEPRSDTGRDLSPTLWRIGGGLAIAHVVVLFAGLSQEVSVVHGDSLTTIDKVYGGANLSRVFAGGYVEAMSFLVLTAAVVVVARLIGRRTEAGRLAAQTFLALGVVFVASTLAVGFAPGAAALYGAQHGADIHSVAMVNDIRNFGYSLQVAVQGGMALALGIAALAEKVFTKWVGWVGVTVGTLGIVVTPFAQNGPGMVWLVWWVGLGVLFLKGGPKTTRNR
jgi:hypothetical protein